MKVWEYIILYLGWRRGLFLRVKAKAHTISTPTKRMDYRMLVSRSRDG